MQQWVVWKNTPSGMKVELADSVHSRGSKMTRLFLVILLVLELVVCKQRTKLKTRRKGTTTSTTEETEMMETSTPKWGFHWRYAAEHDWPGKMCKEGQGVRQSPIDIKTSAVKADFANRFIKHGRLKFHGYKNALVSGINNGYTVQFSTEGDASMHPTVTGGPLRDFYRLEQLHFHWVSEHAVDGKKFPMELHFVHVRVGLDVNRALNEPDGLAIVAVFCNVISVFGDKTNAVGEELIQHIPSLLTPGSKLSGVMLNMETLLSKEQNEYYTYAGSLTSPECNEAVIWIIFKNPIYFTYELHQLFGKAGIGENNFRSLQPITKQIVYTPPRRKVLTPAIVLAFSSFTKFVKDFFLNITSFFTKGVLTK